MHCRAMPEDLAAAIELHVADTEAACFVTLSAEIFTDDCIAFIS